ncbi:MAG: hypothetical protein QM791_13205 [Ferruginibacter sp.]
MLKQVTAFVLLTAFAIQTFSKAFIVFDYLTNTKSFAKNCENKARPKMHCNGKCQMMKKLKQEEKKDEQSPERKAEHKNEYVLSSKSFYPVIAFNTKELKQSFSLFNTGSEVKMPRSLLRPPIC